MDVLSRMLYLAHNISEFKDIRLLTRSCVITHLFSTDDVMLLFHASAQVTHNLPQVLIDPA